MTVIQRKVCLLGATAVGKTSLVRQFVVTYAINFVILAVGSVVLDVLSRGRVELELGGFLVLLLTLLITLFDRYRPAQIPRFQHGLTVARPDIPIPG